MCHVLSKRSDLELASAALVLSCRCRCAARIAFMSSVLPLFGSFVLVYTAVYAAASTEVIQGYAYRGDIYDDTNPVPRSERGPTPNKNLTAGAVTVSDLLITQQATNASVGEALGFCVALRDGGPSQCQLTTQLASGTIQVWQQALITLHS